MGVDTENTEEISIFLTKKDKTKHGKKLQEIYPYIKIDTIDDECLGGCKCYYKKMNIFIDNTLKLAIDEQVENRRW